MAVFNTFTFDGENSLDYGVYITGEAVYNAPERAVEMVSIPGKNGTLALDQGRFENIEVTYPAGTFGAEQAEFAGRMRAFRNMLASRYNYVRLTDSYHPDEYRLGLYKSGLEATPVAMSSAGEFDITFNCKPQRFLTSGEEPIDTSELGGEVTTDREPYLFRRSGGGNIGHDFDAEIDKIIGGTVAWNQLVQNGNFADTSSWYVANDGATISVSSNILTMTYTLAPTSYYSNRLYNVNMPVVGGHKYLLLATVKPSKSGKISVYLNAMSSSLHDQTSVSANTWTTISNMGIAEANGTSFTLALGSDYSNFGVGDTIQVKDAMCIDLTALFGSAEIADYVYSLEQTTAGAGVAWLRNHGFIDGSYRAYNSGSLQSVKTSEHRTTGKNQILRPYADSLEKTINGVTYKVLSDGGIKVSGTAQSDNTYFNIHSNQAPLKLIPGKTYTASRAKYNDGIICGFGKVINGSGIWGFSLNQDRTFVAEDIDGYFAYLQVANGTTVDAIAYVQIEFGSTATEYEPYESHSYPLDSDLELRGIPKLDSSNNLYYDGDVYESSGAVTREYGIRAYQSGDESLTDAITDGTNTVYKLTTPTTETADPYQRIQIVDNNGTEEYVDTRDVPIPVGHETKYGMSQLVLTNPTEFPSKPLLEVTGVGTFWLGDTLFTITGTAGQTIYIDCETGEAWKNVGGIITPANGLVTLNRLDFPELDPGDTPVMYGTGITKVVVTPRWWII